MPTSVTRDEVVYPPTLREVMLRPWWLGMLLLALVVAGVFAWLGQWQLSRAIDPTPQEPGATETIRPIEDVTSPGDALPEPLVGQRVEVEGVWVASDFIVVSARYNDGQEGYWVTGHVDVETGLGERAALAVAIGWTPNRADANAAATALADRVAGEEGSPVELVGRLVSDEGASAPPVGADPYELTRMSPAMLLSRWAEPDGLAVYRPYLVAQETGFADLPDGLVPIDSPPPAELSTVNWLNVFYAAEWVIFAGFAFYMWYRLARDAWEREVEELLEDEDAGPDSDGSPSDAPVTSAPSAN